LHSKEKRWSKPTTREELMPFSSPWKV